MMESKWIKDNTQVWFTPGGDSVWICENCGGGRHVYGIENINEPLVECPDCGAEMIGYTIGVKKV